LLKTSLQDAYTDCDKKIKDLNEQLTSQILKFEESNAFTIEKHMEEIDVLNAKILTLEENGSLPSQTVFENKKIRKDTILKTKHERIVCDKCFRCPIIGKRFKLLSGSCYDFCEKCFSETPVDGPIIEFYQPCSFPTPEQFEDLLPYLKMFLSDVYDGKCKVHFNKGFKK